MIAEGLLGVDKMVFFGAFAARSLSAADPCLSPFPSFLRAYETVMDLLARNWPFMASMAASADSKLSNDTKPKPFDAPVSGSTLILGVCEILPKAEKVS